jgi:hypothetical protein
MRVLQLKLFRKEKVIFGGSHLRGNPTCRRPFSKKCDSHLILKSKHAVGERSFLRKSNRNAIKSIIETAAKTFYVTLRRNINVGNHLHLLIHAPNAEMQRNFLRTIAALIARHVTNSHRGKASSIKKFWDGRPFSRLVPWGRAYKAVLNYLSLNSLEAIGFGKMEAREYLRTFSTS